MSPAIVIMLSYIAAGRRVAITHAALLACRVGAALHSWGFARVGVATEPAEGPVPEPWHTAQIGGIQVPPAESSAQAAEVQIGQVWESVDHPTRTQHHGPPSGMCDVIAPGDGEIQGSWKMRRRSDGKTIYMHESARCAGRWVLRAPAPAAVASREHPVRVAQEARRPATWAPLPDLYRAAAGDVRDFARGEGRASAARASLLACARRDPNTAEALIVYVERLDHYTPALLDVVAKSLDRCAELAEGAAPVAGAKPAAETAADDVNCRCGRRMTPGEAVPCAPCRERDDAMVTFSDVANPRSLALAVAGAWGGDIAPGWPTIAAAREYLAIALLPAPPADLRARLSRYRAAIAKPNVGA